MVQAILKSVTHALVEAIDLSGVSYFTEITGAVPILIFVLPPLQGHCKASTLQTTE